MRLIGIRFPKLIPNVAPTIAPVELAAILARREAVKETGLPPEKIGVFAIVPCSAQVTAALAGRAYVIPEDVQYVAPHVLCHRLSTGGGAVLRSENVAALRQNGPVVFIDRLLELLRTGGGRPLSTDRAALAAMEKKRRPLYEAAADIRIPNNTDVFRRAAKAAEEALHAYFGT